MIRCRAAIDLRRDWTSGTCVGRRGPALELAIVELAPNDLIDSLAVAAGLLEALVALPPDSAPAITLGPATVERARKALAAWHGWIGGRKKRA